MNPTIFTCIMAGGIGSRFWPKSRQSFPKQFIDVLGTGESLLQLTWNRASKLSTKENILVLTNQDYQQLVREQLPEIPKENIIGEPSRNNTAPCLAYAALKLYKKDPEAIMTVLPSDHLILKEAAFQTTVTAATDYAAKNDVLITIGIKPTRPDIGYGYIHFDRCEKNEVCKVISFKEKPPAELALEYVQHGDYLWNAGMFVWKVSTFLNALKTYAPDVYSILNEGSAFYNTEKEETFVRHYYPQTPNISIDYAVMENADNIYTIPADMGWSDLGTWTSLYEISMQDAQKNAVLEGIPLLTNTSNTLISVPKNKIVAIDGLDNYMVIDNDNALLIYPMEKEQQIKEVTSNLKQKRLTSFL